VLIVVNDPLAFEVLFCYELGLCHDWRLTDVLPFVTTFSTSQFPSLPWIHEADALTLSTVLTMPVLDLSRQYLNNIEVTSALEQCVDNALLDVFRQYWNNIEVTLAWNSVLTMLVLYVRKQLE